MRNVIFTAVAAIVLAAGTVPSLAAHSGTSAAQSQQQQADQQNAQHNNRCADVRANPEAYSRIEAENCR
jgi:hemolysin activation/secretion protein